MLHPIVNKFKTQYINAVTAAIVFEWQRLQRFITFYEKLSICYLKAAQIKELQRKEAEMKVSVEEAYEIWWEKVEKLRNKFCRETRLIGYEKEDLEQECYFLFREAWEHYDESMGIIFPVYYRVKLHGWRANMNRKIKLRQVTLLEDETEYADESISVENEIIRKMLCETYLSQLSEGEQELLCAYYLKQEPLKSIAQRLNLKYKSAENKKKKALDKLRKLV